MSVQFENKITTPCRRPYCLVCMACRAILPVPPLGSTYHNLDGGAGTTLYVKESGPGNTGWVAK